MRRPDFVVISFRIYDLEHSCSVYESTGRKSPASKPVKAAVPCQANKPPLKRCTTDSFIIATMSLRDDPRVRLQPTTEFQVRTEKNQ